MTKSNWYFAYFYLITVLFSSCKEQDKKLVEVKQEETPDWSYAQNFYLHGITNAMAYMDTLATVSKESTAAKEIFAKAREEFKKAEPFASYLKPEVGHRANGPALPVVMDDSQKVLLPTGLQKLEESIYEEGESEERYQEEIQVTKGMFAILQKAMQKREVTSERFFIATHQQLLRIISLGISGFDTPVSHLGLSETIVSLESLRKVYTKTPLQSKILEKTSNLDADFQKNVTRAVQFMKENTDFETFDRFTFIRDYMNPITRDWVAIRKASGFWEGVNHKPFNFDAPTFFEEDSFNLNFFTPVVNRRPTEKQIALGEKLFFDPTLSESGTMACATCHIPEKAYGDGMVFNRDKNGNPLKRNTPTLINVAFQQSFFWDGRAPTILNQITNVFNNDNEFNNSAHEFSTQILKDTTYVPLFKEAFGRIPKRNTEIIRAISSYISTLNGFNSKFDRNMRGEEDTFTEDEKLGFNLYMGKALCATCHFIPLTNGTVPPFFTEHEREVIGVPETAGNKTLDDDLGTYLLPNSDLDVYYGMFKTPTVRNAEVTAPYMHNGVYTTLEQVMDFYNKGGGGGMGFDLEFQTLPFDKLNLTQEEQNAIIAFMKTLTDTAVDEPKEETSEQVAGI
ncbi:MAG: cytochrome c peroxidase [Bacteroidota bacterium]